MTAPAAEMVLPVAEMVLPVALALDTATPYLAEFEPTDAGKTAHYMIRWRLRDGSVGAWGDTVSATITA